jgi:hypothetical protein
MPRPASPELRERIFGAASQAITSPSAPFRFADFTQWLVPVFGCFLLMIGTLSSRYPAHDVSIIATNMLLSENTAAYAGSIEHSEKNALPAAHVEWTFGNRPSTTSYSGAVSYTNKIIQ